MLIAVLVAMRLWRRGDRLVAVVVAGYWLLLAAAVASSVFSLRDAAMVVGWMVSDWLMDEWLARFGFYDALAKLKEP